MPLIKVRKIDYMCNYAYAPPKVDALINPSEIVNVVPTEARGQGPFVLIKFRDGSYMTCQATVDEILASSGEPK